MITSQAATIPVSPDAEAAVLGSLLIDANCLDDVGSLTAEDFYSERNRWIFKTMLDMRQEGRIVDSLTLEDELRQRKQWDALGGTAYMMGLIQRVPTAVYIGHYAQIVEHYARRRRLIGAAQEISALAYDMGKDDTDVSAQSVAALEKALAVAHGTDLLTWGDSFAAFNTWQLEDSAAKAENVPVLSLPWPCLSFVRPLQPGSFGIVAADSGVGKTIFLECCADVWARRGFQVAFFHTEIVHREMLKRRVCRWANITMSDVDGTGLTEAMDRAEQIAKSWPGAINYVHCAGWRMGQVVSRARSMIRQGLAQVVIIDYLQDLGMTEYVRGQNPADMRGGDAKLVKQFAEREGVPVLSGSQFNRAAAKDGTKTRSNLRDSAVYDQKASLVITLNRAVLKAAMFDDERKIIAAVGEMSPETVVRVDKQTFGKTGTAKLWTEGRRFLMTEIAQGGTR
jgi:replicative DNA helicase